MGVPKAQGAVSGSLKEILEFSTTHLGFNDLRSTTWILNPRRRLTLAGGSCFECREAKKIYHRSLKIAKVSGTMAICWEATESSVCRVLYVDPKVRDCGDQRSLGVLEACSRGLNGVEEPIV